MRAENFDVQIIIERLQGQCMLSLNDAIEEEYPEMTEDDLTPEDHNAIDNEIFLCDECGWWCEISEATDIESEDGKCKDCAGDE